MMVGAIGGDLMSSVFKAKMTEQCLHNSFSFKLQSETLSTPIHSVSKYLLSFNYVPRTELIVRAAEMNETENVPPI